MVGVFSQRFCLSWRKGIIAAPREKDMVQRMELFEAIEKRRSVRAFRLDPLRKGDLERILGSAILAPSAGNLQPWSFVVSMEGAIKEALAEAALNQEFIAEAPVLITVCAMEEHSAKRYGDRGMTLYCVQDTAAAIENMLLSATALGYGACWIGAFNEGKVRQILSIPPMARPVALIPVGVPKEEPTKTTRKPLEAVVHRETYGGSRLSQRPRRQRLPRGTSGC
jgi:nitroreductase